MYCACCTGAAVFNELDLVHFVVTGLEVAGRALPPKLLYFLEEYMDTLKQALTTYYLLPTTCYLLLTTYYLPLTTYYLLPTTCYFLLATDY